MDAFGQQRFARACECDQPRCEVHAVAENGVVIRVDAAQRTGHHFSTGNTNVGLQWMERCLADPVKRCMNIQGSACRAERIVVMRPRRAKQRHHRIADMFVDRSSVADYNAIHQSSEPSYEFTDFLRIERSRQGCETA